MPHRFRQYDIARCFNIEVNGTHNAVVDDFIMTQIFQRLIPVLSRAGLRSAEDLVRLTKNFKGGDAGRFRYEYFAAIWSAIENVSPITARTMRGR